MSPTVAVIHTTPVTVDPIKALIAELVPDSTVVNFVDDSILPQLMRNGGDLGEVERRFTHYARFAEEVGADAILSACSSVGPLVSGVRSEVSIPVVRIDAAMARAAVDSGDRVGVAATLPTTLRPTMELLEAEARQKGVSVELTQCLVEEAYRRLSAGDRAGHDEVLARELERLAQDVDVVVLAQASMAGVLDALPEALRAKFRTSPRSGVERLARALEEAGTSP